VFESIYLYKNKNMNWQYIVSNPKILEGKPIIKGTRISVALILEWIANGSTINDIHYEFPQLSLEAIQEAIHYAAQRSRNEFFYEIKVA
jgi:uncharacterized protein (DUF433 family)